MRIRVLKWLFLVGRALVSFEKRSNVKVPYFKCIFILIILPPKLSKYWYQVIWMVCLLKGTPTTTCSKCWLLQFVYSRFSVHYQKLETLPILIFNTITLEKINMDITIFSSPFAKLLKSLTIWCKMKRKEFSSIPFYIVYYIVMKGPLMINIIITL